MWGVMGSPGEYKCPVRCWTGDAGPLQTLLADVAWMEELVVLWAPRGMGRAGRGRSTLWMAPGPQRVEETSEHLTASGRG